MNQILKLGLLILLALSITSCEDDKCVSSQLADQVLDNDSAVFQEWKDARVYVYKDEFGKEFDYVVSQNFDSIRHISLVRNCDIGSAKVMYNTELVYRKFTYRKNNTSITYTHDVEFTLYETDFSETSLVDLLSVGVYDDNLPVNTSLGYISLVTSGKARGMTISELNSFHNVQHDSLPIGGIMYYGIYEFKGQSNAYYAADIGLVSFTDNSGNVLYFERIEL